jgi:superfamily II DNA or RNA helicase
VKPPVPARRPPPPPELPADPAPAPFGAPLKPAPSASGTALPSGPGPVFSRAAEPGHPLARLGHDAQCVLLGFVLGWTARHRGAVPHALSALGLRDARGRPFSTETVQAVLRPLALGGWLEELPQRVGVWRVPPERRSALYLDALDTLGLPRLRDGLRATLRFDGARGAPFPDVETGAALVRLELMARVPQAEVQRLRDHCRYGVTWAEVVNAAVMDGLDEAMFERLPRGVQRQVLEHLASKELAEWQPAALPVDRLARAWLDRPAAGPGADAQEADDTPLRLMCACRALWSDAPEQARALLAPSNGAAPSASPGPASDAAPPARRAVAGTAPDADAATGAGHALAAVVDAAVLAREGRWPEAEAAYEPALAQLKALTGKRKGLLPELLALPYVLALLAQGSPSHLDRALRFCLAESGKRQGSGDSGFGVVALGIEARRGSGRLDLASLRPVSNARFVYPIDLWRWLVRAWLKTGSEPAELHPREHEAAAALAERLRALAMPGLAAQVDDALAVLRGESASPAFFVPSAQEAWRLTLAELATLGDAPGAPTDPDGQPVTRLLWVLDVAPDGALRGLTPHEQKRGQRGWGKPREVPLTRLTRTEGLPPHDAAVALCLRAPPFGQRGHRFDLAAAASALVGHPSLELASAPGTAVELVEGQSEIDVTDAGEAVELRLVPPLRASAESPQSHWATSAAELKELEALRRVTILRDGPQRLRLIRLTDAQQRAAQLIGDKLVVPRAALPQVQAVLQRLGSHFQVHADVAPSAAQAREVTADARLRAELSPRGEALSLRLVVAPLGLAGPRLPPGHGRARLLAAVDGETLSAQRDLALERSHLETVLDACPMLGEADDPRDGAPTQIEWLIESPDAALALLERLPTLNALAGIDWPQGKAVRVDSAGVGQLKVSLRNGREWLALQGGVQVDEQQVLGLEQLISWTRGNPSRFVPLGEGRYLALTQELRQRLDELSSVAAPAAGKGAAAGEVQVPALAAGWLDDTLAGAQFQADAAYRRRLEQLADSQRLQPRPPRGLQAELRPYQEEGYAWALRLADAGFGAVLADDMGLGKTLQALAVLLARAPGGAALVVAPTSLGGNWLAEARRFAPGLTVRVFGEGDRAAMVEAAGPGEVLVVSYQLLLGHAADFGRRTWHTLVLDEAQAIKNATAKRSQAAFELQADFRLALSGTPIENRLAELWSIMRLCNPGLLGTARQFNERFAGPIERDRNRSAQRTLRRLIAPFVLRRTKAQVLDDLPPRTETTLPVTPDATERAHYEVLRRQALAAAEHAVASDKPGEAQLNILAQLTRLRRAACDPRLVSPELKLVGAKVQAFGELAAELTANGHKALVFSQFVDFLALLREPLDAAGIAYQYLDGSTPAAERTRRVAAFQAGEGELFLISLKAGGFGLNLTGADYVVIADPWWNPAAEDQAAGRAHRIGQQRPVTVYRLVAQGTLEEKIVALHQHKRELADGVLDGADGGGGRLDPGELLGLMRGEEVDGE